MIDVDSPETVDLDDYQIPDLPRCRGCQALVIAPWHWKKASDDERQEMLDDDFVRANRAGLCSTCAPRELSDVSRQRMGLRGDTLRVYREMTAQGKTAQDVADRLGIKRRTVMKVASDARKKGELV